MTDDQRTKLQALARVTMLPGSFDKRFVRDVGGYGAEKELSEKQAALVETLWHRYRRQLAKKGGTTC